MNKLRNGWKKVLSMILCMIFVANCNALHVYATEDEENESGEDPIIVVSLGDSYSSGEGIELFYEQDKTMEDKINSPTQDWLAHRSTKSWASQLRVGGLEGTLGEHRDENWFFV